MFVGETMERIKLEIDELRSQRKIAFVLVLFGLFLMGFVKNEPALYSGFVITTLAFIAVIALCKKIAKKIAEL